MTPLAANVRRAGAVIELVTASVVSAASVALAVGAPAVSQPPSTGVVIARAEGAAFGWSSDHQPWQHQIHGRTVGYRGPCSSAA
jgi:hypothetical protein